MCKNLDPIGTAWNHRPLGDERFPFVVVDAITKNVREDDRIQSRGLLIATGVHTDGYREVLGFHVGARESASTWRT